MRSQKALFTGFLLLASTGWKAECLAITLISTGAGGESPSYVLSLLGSVPLLDGDPVVEIPTGNITDVEFEHTSTSKFWISRSTPSPGPVAPGFALYDNTTLLQDYPINDLGSDIAISNANKVVVTGSQGRLFSPNPDTLQADIILVVGPGPSVDGPRDGRLHAVDFDPDGNLFYFSEDITDSTHHRLFKIPAGVLTSATAANPLFIPFSDPTYLAVDLITPPGSGPTALLSESTTSVLYGTNAGEIYRISLPTADVQLLPGSPLPGTGPLEDLERDGFGKLLANRGSALYAVDPSSGESFLLYNAAQRIFGISGDGVAVPEPCTISLFLVSFVASATGARRYERKC